MTTTLAAAARAPTPSRVDVAVACVLAAGFALLFALSLQERLWGDGRDILNLLVWDERAWWRSWPHVLHTHVALLFGALGPFERVHDDYALASAVPAGVAVGALYFASRMLGAARLAAAFAAVVAGCEMMGDSGKSLPRRDAKAYAEKNGFRFLDGREIVEAWRKWSE